MLNANYVKSLQMSIKYLVFEFGRFVMSNPIGNEIDYFLASTAFDENRMLLDVVEFSADDLAA